MTRLVWLDSAQRDMRDIVSYYTEKASAKIAANLLQRIVQSAEHLIEQPYMGVPAYDDLLEWNIPDLAYTLPYRVMGDDIEILRVFHQSQKKPSKWEQEK